MVNKNIIINWKKLIAEDNLDHLFKEMYTQIDPKSEMYDDFILIYNQYSNLNRKFGLGIINQFDANSKIQLNDRVLKYLSELTLEDLKDSSSGLDHQLFGSEWDLEDYYHWLKRKLKYYKIALLLSQEDKESNDIHFLSLTRIFSVDIGKRYYPNDTLIIKEQTFSLKFDNPDQEDGDGKFYYHGVDKPYDIESSLILVPLDIISEIKFIDNPEDEYYKSICPSNVYLLRVFTKGKHIYHNKVLVDVIAIPFFDKELCINVLNAFQYIMNNRQSFSFDTESGQPIIPEDFIPK